MANKTTAYPLSAFVKVIQKKKMAELWDNKEDEVWETA
jgi:hypothetical protein